MKAAETQSPFERKEPDVKTPPQKDAQTVTHEKVLRLECLKLATGITTKNNEDILRISKEFSSYVIGDA